MSVARHGDTLYTAASDQTVRRWSPATPGQWVWELPEEPDAVAISPDASLIAVGFVNGALRVYDRVTGAELSGSAVVCNTTRPIGDTPQHPPAFVVAAGRFF